MEKKFYQNGTGTQYGERAVAKLIYYSDQPINLKAYEGQIFKIKKGHDYMLFKFRLNYVNARKTYELCLAIEAILKKLRGEFFIDTLKRKFKGSEVTEKFFKYCDNFINVCYNITESY